MIKGRERSPSKKSSKRRSSVKPAAERKQKDLERTFSSTSFLSQSDRLSLSCSNNFEKDNLSSPRSGNDDDSFLQRGASEGVDECRTSEFASFGMESGDTDELKEGIHKLRYNDNISDGRFKHPIYEKSSEVLAYLNGDCTVDKLPSFKDDLQKRRVLSLAFAAHRYRDVLKDALIDSHFYSSFSKFEALYENQVKVLLLDYYNNGFRFSDNRRNLLVEDQETHIPHIFEIQSAMMKLQIQISSAFARNRIKACALDLEGFLPDTSQERKRFAKFQPLYTRMNSEKMPFDSILTALIGDGFTLKEECDPEALKEMDFMRDPHFHNALVFSEDCKDEIYAHLFTQYGILIPQDKSKFLIVETAKECFKEAAAQREKASTLIGVEGNILIQDQEDLLLAYPESGALISHLAEIMETGRQIFVCGCTKMRKGELSKRLSRLSIQNVNIELLEESFLATNINDEKFKKVKLILCNVPCSKSGVVNLEDFVLQESTEVMKQLVYHVDAGKLQAITSEESRSLRHAFRFSQAQSVIYFTNSISKEENEDTVLKTMKTYLTETTSKNPFELQVLLPSIVADLRSYIHSYFTRQHIKPFELNEGKEGKYVKIPVSNIMNGFFISLFKRKYLDGSPREIIERVTKKTAKGVKGAKKKKKKKGSKKNSREVASEETGDEEYANSSSIISDSVGTRAGSPSTYDSGISLNVSKNELQSYDSHSRRVPKKKTKVKKKKAKPVKDPPESPHKH